MLRAAFASLVTLSACSPAIPTVRVEPRATLPASLPVLAPCALVHAEIDEDLSNGARGGGRGPWRLAYASFLMRHPKGAVLVDAAFGSRTNADFDRTELWFRLNFGAARAAKPLAALLAARGVRPADVTHVLLTHAHWDHAGGLADLPRARVIMAEAEAERVFATTLDALAEPLVMPWHFDAVRGRVDPLAFTGGPYDGFPRSQDVFGDGSVVAVPTPGHTPGATSWFVNSGDGRRWLFVGDAAWVKEGVEEPVHKGRLASVLTDWNGAAAAESLGRIHAIQASGAAVVVTSHDERTWVGVPRCGAN